eukprot:4634006-Pyramimonas_sp.AAC.1
MPIACMDRVRKAASKCGSCPVRNPSVTTYWCRREAASKTVLANDLVQDASSTTSVNSDTGCIASMSTNKYMRDLHKAASSTPTSPAMLSMRAANSGGQRSASLL